MAPKRKPAHRKSLIKSEFDVELTVLGNRQIFLYEEVTQVVAQRINKELFALDTINNNPIMLYINSEGGNCACGLSIINTMRSIDSPVVTIITGEASSISAHISVSGNKRICYDDAVWFEHEISTYFEGGSAKLNRHNDFIKKYKKLLNDNLKAYTKLSESDIKKIDIEDMYLFADEMLEKNIVDEVIVNV